MKKITAIILTTITLSLLQSCGKEDVEVSFNIPNSVNDCLPANPFQGPVQYYSTNVTKQEVLGFLKNEGVSVDESNLEKLQSLKLDAISVEILDGLTFDDIANVSAFIRPISTEPIAEENRGKQIAYTENVSPGATTVELKITGEDFVEIYKNNSSLQLIVSVLNKDKTSTGGTPRICFKTTGTKFSAKASAK